MEKILKYEDDKFHIRINVDAPSAELLSEEMKQSLNESLFRIKETLLVDFYKNDPETILIAQRAKDQLLSCFQGRDIYAKPIKNGYCGLACCSYLPWFEVTTRFGIIKIGWRKHVIVLDWGESAISQTACEIFADEDVTKEGRLIHAWSLEKAKEYIDVLFIAQMPGTRQGSNEETIQVFRGD